MPDTVLPPDAAPPVAPPETSAAPPAPVVETAAVTEEAHTPAVEPEAVREPEVEHVETPTAPVESEAPLVEPLSAPEMEEAEVAEETAEIDGESAPEAIDEPPAEPETNKRWYVVKVQSGREDTIKEAIERRVKIEALEEFYGEIVIPTETVVEMRKGKRVKKERKLYPGYIMAFVEYNDRILYLFRETSGVGDFVGGTITRPPPPMSKKEIDTMLGKKPGKDGGDGKVKELPTKPEYAPGIA